MEGKRNARILSLDRAISVGELEAYVVANVQRTAGQLDREQTPQVVGRDRSRVLVRS